MGLSIEQLLPKSLNEELKNTLLDLELRAASATDADAVDFMENIASQNEAAAIREVLARVEAAFVTSINEHESKSNPDACIITGVPGSGKSFLSHDLVENTGHVYICGDEIKKSFIREIKNHSLLAKNARLTDAIFLHRLTSPINWCLYDYAVWHHKDIVVEMIGSDSKLDAQMIFALAKTHKVSLFHVATRIENSIENAISRYFDPANADYGRYISLVDIAENHSKIIKAFNETVWTLALNGLDCQVTVFDNSERRMVSIFDAKIARNSLPDLSDFTRAVRQMDDRFKDSRTEAPDCSL
ncbi:MAG: zeta toxin family protein [Betaproteobacteria bacterium]|nr:zeta toxin family protein [Betaproteobacteria bacterium]